MRNSLKKIVIGLGLLLLLVTVGMVAGGVWVWLQLQPVNANMLGTDQTFVIPKGQAISVIANRLEEAELINNALVFRVLVKVTDLESKIQFGSFELAPTMSMAEIAEQLTKGTNDIWLTVLEGWRTEEIADSLDELDLPAYDREEFLAAARGQEGRLFPDSYLIPKDFTSTQIVNLLTSTFEKKVETGLSPEFSATERTPEEILVMASLVEREARGYEQMRRVAGILWNRIEIGMALQVDATLQYLEGYNKTQQTWWAPPAPATKAVQSPFNTYLNPGLPPRPIANPGLDAIEATLNPAESNNLYYLHSRDGEIYYAETLEEHNANIERYLR